MSNPFIEAILEGEEIKSHRIFRCELLDSEWLNQVTSFLCKGICEKTAAGSHEIKVYWGDLLALHIQPIKTVAHYQIAAKLLLVHIEFLNNHEKRIRFDWSSFKPGVVNEYSFVKIEWGSNVV